ncbi:MAG: DUF2065 domain-containing protein [Paracoccaceae bacterium]
MSYLFLALGLVLILEGLVYALAPSIVERLLEALKSMPVEARRQVGFLTVVSGAILLWVANYLGV